MLANCQTQPGTTVLARRGAVGLRELLEEAAKLFLRHPDASVGHSEDQPFGGSVSFAPGCKTYLALLCEFARIAEQIQEHLTHPGQVRLHHTNIRRTVDDELVAVPVSDRLGRLCEFANECYDIDLLWV